MAMMANLAHAEGWRGGEGWGGEGGDDWGGGLGLIFGMGMEGAEMPPPPVYAQPTPSY